VKKEASGNKSWRISLKKKEGEKKEGKKDKARSFGRCLRGKSEVLIIRTRRQEEKGRRRIGRKGLLAICRANGTRSTSHGNKRAAGKDHPVLIRCRRGGDVGGYRKRVDHTESVQEEKKARGRRGAIT